MPYDIYKVIYKTERGSFREYVGYTGDADLRKWWHKQRPPTWMKCKAENEGFQFLERGLATKAAARASEALYAAREIAKSPSLVRGGPWLTLKLSAAELQEIHVVARTRSLLVLDELARANPSGRLARHLKGLAFVRPGSEAPAGAVLTRGAQVVQKRKPGKSGKCGNWSRKDQVRRNVLKKPSAAHRILQRGRDPSACRAKENTKRER